MNQEIFKAIKIMGENDDWLVIDKPAGLAVHPGGNIKEKTLTDWLQARYPNIVEVGEDPLRPGIVHRLDKEVSGLMVIAKTQTAFDYLKKQFQERKVTKEYMALVHGKIQNDSGDIDFPIKRSRAGHKMAAIPKNTLELLSRKHPSERDQGNIDGGIKAREAITAFDVVRRLVNYTLVKVKIKTGRTHQIRVHFFALGYPLLGDRLYASKKSKEKNNKIGLNRVWLFAEHLAFKGPDGEKYEFRAACPDELEQVLKTLK